MQRRYRDEIQTADGRRRFRAGVLCVDAVLFRRTRMNAVGEACSAGLAACDAAPLGQKLECVGVRPKSDGCAAAMSMLSQAAF